MASHQLIETYLAELRRRLPAAIIDELADGLIETYQHHLTEGAAREVAATLTIAEFGDPDTITDAFTRQAPGRHAARALLATGPAVGLCWAATLLLGHAWTWPIPTPLRLAFAITLLAVTATLATAATSRRSYTRTRIAALGGLGLIALDIAMVSIVVVTVPVLTWPMAAAIPASLARVGLTARTLPPILAR
jgi:hypothetical protein